MILSLLIHHASCHLNDIAYNSDCALQHDIDGRIPNHITLFSELEFVYWLKHIQKRALDFDYREPLAEKLVKYSRKLEYSIPFLVQTIPDIGEELARALLLHFGSILAICKASIKDLKEVPKIGQKKAEYIYNFVREDYRNLHYTPKQIGVN